MPSTASDPLFDGGQTQYPETEIIEAIVRRGGEALRRAHVARTIEPGTTA
ncbi:MAG: hypothetical protein U1D41_11860 [Nitrosomonas sp.]|nr:hypothetical protein [Nitrosomonas sp.]MDP3281791.1 hypothetical protein [Nitrosomonas sp.]MDP3663156.1 hypothetical protein [Nitrosomonas sp.]MDZ4106834.1 hypothetical protein [Nitrosomonas sp.]